MLLEIAFLLSSTCVIWWVITRWQSQQQRDKLGLPGPPIKFLWGTMHHYGEWLTKRGKLLHVFQMEQIQKYGKVYGEYMGGHLQVFVADVEMVKEVLVKQFPNFVNRMRMVMSNVEPMRDTLICNEGQRWKDVRSVLSPTFSSGKLKQLAFIMDEKIEIFMDLMREKAAKGEEFDIMANWQGLTLDVIGQAAFAVEVDCQRNHQDPFYVNCRKFFNDADFESSPLLMASAILNELDSVTGHLRPYTSMGKSESVLVNALRGVVAQRMDNVDKFQGMDILQLLLKPGEGKKAELSKETIIGNSYVFLLAGYETTSSALTFTAWALAKHPDVQAKLQEEIKAMLPEGGLDWEVLSKMPYLDAVFHESLRLFPPVAQFVARTCVNSTEVGGYRFDKGTEVVIPVYAIHQDPEYWPEPEKFKPERFYKNRDWEPCAWLPFGGGPRNCIGLRFAEMEYKKAVVGLLREFSLGQGPSFEAEMVPVARAALIAPPNGVVVKLTKAH